ncbi:Acyl transferase/acyl hydrolase/lysophospholipase [Penicillium italicum]|uniref:Acyl transferase/acyl hydrolase/lysophospholipase n=1 Tax=Penicillium italicum TaxID=40296 RepID=A0A0A2KY03_PENIT|nr:Acyl transferase/acyl hydrolase/lysophospholipase [Penicillium italicum]
MTIKDSHIGPQRFQFGTSLSSASHEPPNKSFSQEPIAVVGMACRLPGHSNSLKALWDFLERGGIAANEAPESRFNLKAHHDGSKKPKTMRSPGGMFIEEIDPKVFDAGFFGISGTDALAMDPQQRQLLEVVYECIENSGTTMEKLHGAPIACFVGSYGVDYGDMQARDPEDRVPGVTIGVGRAILSNRISHFFNFKGPSMTIDTACSGSLVGVDVACRYLYTGEADGAIIAGANLYLSPEHNTDSGAMKGASSLTGKCHTFDVKADGYIKGEAINAVYLKRLKDAVRDGDPIRAVIRGTATNSDGRTPGIASPSAEAQASAIRAAYANAGISDLNQTGYLECHGTGTQAGDPQEVRALSTVFSPTRTNDRPLIIGSIKSNIGHSEPAAGISGLIKAVLAIEHGVIPGNPTFVTPNPAIDFKALNVRATQTKIPWPQTQFKRASVNSFGYGGSNAHVIVEEPSCLLPDWSGAHVSSYRAIAEDFFGDDDDSSSAVGRPFTLAFSANDEPSLRAYVNTLKKHMLNPSVKITLPDLSHTLSERRTRHFHRGYLVAQSTTLDEATLVIGKKAAEEPRIGFIFTGQGAQWSQMGKAIVETFPRARAILQHLDRVLQTSAAAPSWSLLRELTEPRNPEQLRQPEFSQPLVTALQIVLVDILREWGVTPSAVVGHSSGEIAAAYTAGLVSRENTIRAAFYRGQAATMQGGESKIPVGMMAVGIGAEVVAPYLEGVENAVQIACYNGPNSVTLSGTIEGLKMVQTRLAEENIFSRMLQVSLAYHSTFMDGISQGYSNLLAQDFAHNSFRRDDVRMFSSVIGKEMTDAADATYWRDNMVCPVRFDTAVEQMITAKAGPNFLIEIGPSGALAGPVSQILKKLSSTAQYCTAMSRGATAIRSMFDVAGRLFTSGGTIDLASVNQVDGIKPQVIIDLPNYAWNHSTNYWYESEASKDWRNRLFPHHDLLGSKILGSSWHSPSFSKLLKVEDLPWLIDHKMGPDTVFPAAGFMAMAMEAILQRSEALTILEDATKIEKPRYRLRDVAFNKALVLNDSGEPAKINLSLSAHPGFKESWHEFRVSSLAGSIWTEHCRGLVRIEEDVQEVASADAIQPLVYPVDGQAWYKAMSDAGYNFGAIFQKQLQIEVLSGQRSSRSLVSLEAPESAYPQSVYPMHPACIDGCLQTCAPSLWKGTRNDVNAVLVPAIIDDITFTSSQAARGLSWSTAKFVGLGRPDESKNFMSDATVYDPETGNLLFSLKGLRYHKIDTGPSPYDAHTYSSLVWKPDITLLSSDQLANLSSGEEHIQDPSLQVLSEVLTLAAHKKPSLRVMELNMVPGQSDSLWLETIARHEMIRKSYRRFAYYLNDPSALVEAGAKYAESETTEIALLDLTHLVAEEQFDLVIVRLSPSAENLQDLSQRVRAILKDAGQVLFLRQRLAPTDPNLVVNGEAHDFDLGSSHDILRSGGFTDTRHLAFGESSSFGSMYLSSVRVVPDRSGDVALFHFTKPSPAALKAVTALQSRGWSFQAFESSLEPDSITASRVLVLDELETSLFPNLTSDHWDSLKKLLSSNKRVLWVTKGSQLAIADPEKAMIHGLGRTVRAEDPTVSLTTLDVSGSSTDVIVDSIDAVLQQLIGEAPVHNVESEFAELDGIIHVGRIQPDALVNIAESENKNGRALVTQSLHDYPNMVRLQCERTGTTDSLIYTEVAPVELPLRDNCVEVELEAAGLNFKDVAITMGIIPENEHLLGLEGAGTIRRVGKSVDTYTIGQRVLVFERGTFGNRIHATTERVHAIPDSMTYEEASTLASVYLTALYSIYDLANTQSGHRVLIHSATGGLGMASIQICQHIGAEVFATVGNQEKRNLLTEKFNIPADHIFSSRDVSFASELMRVTDGYGVDVILNSLTGDLLDESWRCIASGGTMVELGKRDMLDRNTLSMEPFGRNASYRCFDMSHKHVSNKLIGRLLTQLFELLDAGHVKPIAPITVFPFEDIPSAFRYMRSANHIGKIVISNTAKENKVIDVQVRQSPKSVKLRGDVSYFIVGGLKGLCGSLAISLARVGAKNLTIMSRSGYADDASQRVIQNLQALGCALTLVKGDVSVKSDVQRAVKDSNAPVAGVIQGAMVLRDKVFTSMTIEEYHQAVSCKVQGTWNLHNVLLEENLQVDFFTMLSSVSGVVGQKGQANYAAANAFLDAFATYRQRLGLSANSVDLGAIQDVGYMSQHTDLLVALDSAAWTPINEALFLKIVGFSLRQQLDTINPASSAQLITSIAVPQSESSPLLRDARFSGLCLGDGTEQGAGDAAQDGSKEIKALTLLVKNKAEFGVVQQAVIDVATRQFTSMLRLSQPMEAAKSLGSYGLDSLAAVEFRNWLRLELKVEVTTLEITSAASLMALCERIASRLLG